MSREPRGPFIALPPDTDVEEAFHSLVAAAIDQPRPTPAVRASLNRVLSLIGHPVAESTDSGKQNGIPLPQAFERSA